jgi:lipopolysaccharide/colanic/teichoic acid biosynthesis glycosyltransferase
MSTGNERGPQKPVGTVYAGCKLVAEWCLSLVLLTASAPLLVFVAMLVKLTSSGPVFYSQLRLGRGGTPYRVYKIRTMLHHCEKEVGAVWASKNDPRVTPVGRFLRETHLDEIPQLWNVLRGEMSLIGPRPERPEIAVHLERVLPAYRRRLVVRPGITGLAQLRLPADRDLSGVRRKLSHDLYYIRRVGFLLDLQLAYSTVLYLAARFLKSISELVIRFHGRQAEEMYCNVEKRTPEHSESLELLLPLASTRGIRAMSDEARAA